MSPHRAPTVDDLLADTLIQKVMRADRVEPEALRTLLHGAADRIAARRVPRRDGLVFIGSTNERRPTPRAPMPLLAAPKAARSRDDGCGSALCC